jgi:hypothetical protein
MEGGGKKVKNHDQVILNLNSLTPPQDDQDIGDEGA